MVITKKSETTFEVEFDAGESNVLSNMETLFDTAPADMIQKSLNESIRLMEIGTSDLVDRIHAKLTKDKS